MENDQHRWQRTPKFIMRARCIRDLTCTWRPGRFLEVGAGTGTMTRLFLERGFEGVCHDIASETIDVLTRNLIEYTENLEVTGDLAELRPSSFEYLFAFEVLEHIPDDLGALETWFGFLRPGGMALISVPAHRRKFGPEDVAVGHVRRYERQELIELLARAGFSQTVVANYGYPLGNITRRVQDMVSRFTGRAEALSSQSHVERSVRSGIESSSAVMKVSRLLDERWIAPFARLQRTFYDQDRGDGYVVIARKA